MQRFTSALIILCALSAGAQEAKYGERVDVNVVLLDAIVTDAKGNQILGLQKDDFVVRENGEAQAIDSVGYFTNRHLLNAREENAPFQVERTAEDRYFVFFFDKPQDGQLFGRLALARAAVADFIANRMMENDHVAIVGHDVRLKVYSDFSTDKKQLVRALSDVARFGRGLTRSESTTSPSILAAIDSGAMMNRTGTVYQGIEVLADSLRPIKARKNLVLFSAGIVEPGEDVRDGVLLNTSRYYEPALEALNASNVAVYAMQLIADAQLQPVMHQTLERFSSETSGEYFRFPTSFSSEINRVERTNNGYYLISYYTKKPKGTKGYQKVQVALKDPGLRVKAREGYVYGE